MRARMTVTDRESREITAHGIVLVMDCIPLSIVTDHYLNRSVYI